MSDVSGFTSTYESMDFTFMTGCDICDHSHIPHFLLGLDQQESPRLTQES